MTDLFPHILLITGTFIVAGLVKGVTGLGLPTVAMGLLGLAMSPVQAAALLLVPSLVTNLWQLFTGPRFGALLRRLWGMMLGVVVGTLAGSGLIAGTARHAATAALGGALALYGVVGLAAPARAGSGRALGRSPGRCGDRTGHGSDRRLRCPCRPYLGSLALERDDLVQALSLSFTISTLALAAGLAWHGALHMGATGASLLALVPALAGMVVGGWLRARVRPRPSDLVSSPACLCWGANSCYGG